MTKQETCGRKNLFTEDGESISKGGTKSDVFKWIRMGSPSPCVHSVVHWTRKKFKTTRQLNSFVKETISHGKRKNTHTHGGVGGGHRPTFVCGKFPKNMCKQSCSNGIRTHSNFDFDQFDVRKFNCKAFQCSSKIKQGYAAELWNTDFKLSKQISQSNFV